MRREILAALALSAFLAGGCSVRGYALQRAGDVLAESGSGFGAEEDPELIRAAAPFSLKLMESILGEAPRHPGLLDAAARGFTQYAYAFVQQDAEFAEEHDVEAARAERRRARRLYIRARDYGLRALDTRHPGFGAEFGTRPAQALQRLSRADSASLYWTMAAWTAAISLSKDSAAAIAELPSVDLMVRRLREIDADLGDGALHTFLISYEMGRPGARDPEPQARLHLGHALRLSAGRKAAPFVAFAEGVCVPAGNRREFVAMLGRALAVDLDARPDWRLENTIMQRRAKWLLSQADRLFVE
jgi:predicted anti-sigma-YlaC factor YlaD